MDCNQLLPAPIHDNWFWQTMATIMNYNQLLYKKLQTITIYYNKLRSTIASYAEQKINYQNLQSALNNWPQLKTAQEVRTRSIPSTQAICSPDPYPVIHTSVRDMIHRLDLYPEISGCTVMVSCKCCLKPIHWTVLLPSLPCHARIHSQSARMGRLICNSLLPFVRITPKRSISIFWSHTQVL